MLCILDMRDLNHIHIEDVDYLISCIGRLKDSQLYEEKKLTILTPNSNGYYSFSNLMHFITTDISFFRSLVSLQKRLCECTLGYDRWKAIKRRKIEMIDIWKYRDTHRGESPVEPFCRKLYRDLFGGTNPYKHDYEVPMNNINDYMNDILSYFKVRYHPIPYKELKDPRIVALRRIGSTYSSMKFEPYSFGDNISGLSSNKDGSESNSSNYYLPARARIIISSSSSSSYNNNNNNNAENNNVEEIANYNKKKTSPQSRSPLSPPLKRFESDESAYYNKNVIIKKEQSASTCISKRGKEITIPGTIDEE